MMRVWYIDGSPYARIVRATLIEFGVEHEAIELPGFPPQGVEALTPALQVPVLETEGRRLFGSALIREYLHAEHGRSGGLDPVLVRPERRWDDLQLLAAINTLTDALVIHFHLLWAGVEALGENRLGADPGPREAERAHSLLDWLEGQAGESGFRQNGLSAPDLAFAAAVLWLDAREAFPWRGRTKLERLAEVVGTRSSFRETAPRPWRGSPLRPD